MSKSLSRRGLRRLGPGWPGACLWPWLAALAWAGEPGPGLPGHWTFDEAGGVELREAAGRLPPGAVLNDGRGVRRVPGRVGQALEFSGGDAAARNQAGCAQLSGLEAVDWGQGFTVEAWVRFSRLERSATYEIASCTRDDRGPGWRLMLSWHRLWLRTGEGGDGATWGAASNPSVTRLEAGPWYHFAGTYDGSVFRVYVDGVLAGESEPGLSLPPGEPFVQVGSYRAGYAYGLDGVVDGLRLYGYARSAAEIIAAAKLDQP